VFVFVFLCVIIVYCAFYSVCNTDASDDCAIKITYLLTTFIESHTSPQHPVTKPGENEGVRTH